MTFHHKSSWKVEPLYGQWLFIFWYNDSSFQRTLNKYTMLSFSPWVVSDSFETPWTCNPPGSSVHGISQARILERVAISFSGASSWSRDQGCISCIDRWILYHCTTWEAQIHHAAAAAAKSLQSCPTLCDTIDCSPPGSPVPGILQARTLEWVAISFSNAWKWKVKVKSLSPVWPSAIPWTAAF